jgi:hypothetical protein
MCSLAYFPTEQPAGFLGLGLASKAARHMVAKAFSRLDEGLHYPKRSAA